MISSRIDAGAGALQDSAMDMAAGEGRVRQQQLRALHKAARSKLGDRVVEAAERLLGEPLDERLAAVQVAENEAGFDPFGFDPKVARYALAVAALLHRRYFRTEVHGLEHVPDGGRLLFIANHSGQVPLDGLVIVTSLLLDRDPPIFPRSMVERWTQQLPFVSVLFPRCGQVLGTPDNARRLLEQDQPLMVFPEGAQGIAKPFRERYQLQPFGGGFMRLAHETGATVVPVAVIGAEEQYPSLGSLDGIAKRFGMPVLPLIPQLLVGMVLPLPVRYRLYFGEPMTFEGDADDDDELIEERVAKVRERVQDLVDEGLAQREHVFW